MGEKRAVVLGAGRIGVTMAADLVGGPGALGGPCVEVEGEALAPLAVTLVDASAEALAAAAARLSAAGLALETAQADLGAAEAIAEVVAGADVVLGALPSRMGLAAMEAVIDAGKPYVDISFMADDPSTLNASAETSGACVIYDMGVAPGMTNLLAGWATTQLERTQRLDLMVGGVPAIRHAPFAYKAGFAPSDVIEEYTRPARLVEGGREVVRPALSQVEPVEVAGVGTLEAFNTDGLRSLISTLDVPEMRERTLRWPGHAALMQAFRDSGLFDREPVEVDGQRVVPRAVTEALLFPRWAFSEGEADIVVLRVIAEGTRDGQPTRLRWDLIDRYDPASDTRAMSRTTAFPATITARLLAEGRFDKPGVHAPEELGLDPELTPLILDELQRRGVRYETSA